MKKTAAGYKMVMTYMTPELHGQATALAKSKDLSFCALVRQLLKKAVQKGGSCDAKK